MESLIKDEVPEFQTGAPSIGSGQYGFINLDQPRATYLLPAFSGYYNDSDVYYIGKLADEQVVAAYAVAKDSTTNFRLYLAKTVVAGDVYNTGNGATPGSLWTVWSSGYDPNPHPYPYPIYQGNNPDGPGMKLQFETNGAGDYYIVAEGSKLKSSATSSYSYWVGLTSPTTDIVNAVQSLTSGSSGAASPIVGTSGNDTLTGTTSGDSISSGDGNDLIYADAGNDTIYSGTGNDTVYAGLDNDTVYAGRGDDYIYGGQGNDHIESGIGADTIESGLGNDTVLAGQDNDLVLAGQGNDSVLGGLGNDTLKGGLGNDTIGGNGGDDLLYGNDGADLFVLTSASGADTIADFNAAAGDHILITAGTTYTVSDTAGGALVAFAGGGSVLLQGIAGTAVTAALFTSA